MGPGREERSAPSHSMRHRWTLLLRLSVMMRATAGLSHTPRDGCKTPAVVRAAVGSGKNSAQASKVYDSNLKSKWTSWGEGESILLELATPTVIGSVAIAFRKGDRRIHTFDVFLVKSDDDNTAAELVFVGASNGASRGMQLFHFEERAREATAVVIVGYGNDQNRWNGYAEIELCNYISDETAMEVDDRMETAGPSIEISPMDVAGKSSAVGQEEGHHPEAVFESGRKGFNVVNMCSFPIRVGATGSHVDQCNEGTARNPHDDQCYWALPEGTRDLEPGESVQYVLPELGLVEGSIVWSGNLWASTGCEFSAASHYDYPATTTCVTNFCHDDGSCPPYFGPDGVTTKAEFTLREAGVDFYDVSAIDGANLPMAITPVHAVPNSDDHFCGSPGWTDGQGGLEPCTWSFTPASVEGYNNQDLSMYTRVVWPADPDEPTSCTSDKQCRNDGRERCGIFEERLQRGAIKTGVVKPMVCGRTVGWLGAHTACGAVREDGVKFPDDYPFHCHQKTRHGTNAEVVGFSRRNSPTVVSGRIVSCSTLDRILVKSESS